MQWTPHSLDSLVSNQGMTEMKGSSLGTIN